MCNLTSNAMRDSIKKIESQILSFELSSFSGVGKSLHQRNFQSEISSESKPSLEYLHY